VKAFGGESGELCKSKSDTARAYDTDAPDPVQAKDVEELFAELRDGVAKTTFAKGAKHREVFADLGRRGADQARERVAGNGIRASGVEALEIAQIERKTSYG
jgi:hypothetical protein